MIYTTSCYTFQYIKIISIKRRLWPMTVGTKGFILRKIWIYFREPVFHPYLLLIHPQNTSLPYKTNRMIPVSNNKDITKSSSTSNHFNARSEKGRLWVSRNSCSWSLPMVIVASVNFCKFCRLYFWANLIIFLSSWLSLATKTGMLGIQLYRMVYLI